MLGGEQGVEDPAVLHVLGRVDAQRDEGPDVPELHRLGGRRVDGRLAQRRLHVGAVGEEVEHVVDAVHPLLAQHLGDGPGVVGRRQVDDHVRGGGLVVGLDVHRFCLSLPGPVDATARDTLVPVRDIRAVAGPGSPTPITLAFPDADVSPDDNVSFPGPLSPLRCPPPRRCPHRGRGPQERFPGCRHGDIRTPPLTWAQYDSREGRKGAVVVIVGSERTTRRRGMRRQRDPSLLRFGPDLRQAREELGLSLEAVQDRTGVRRLDLEALEGGDLSRFPDEKSATVAVRRCAEVLGLDAAAMTQIVGEEWRNVNLTRAPGLVGVTGSAPTVARPSAPVPVLAGHLSRFPGDASHLRAFTETAQVPQVGRRPAAAPALPPGLRFDSTDAIPAVPRLRRPAPPPAPLALRVAVWSTLLLLAVGLAGMAVHHWRPAWLARIHLVASGPGGAPPPSAGSSTHTRVPAHLVTQTTSGPQSASVTVRSPAYSVVVTTAAPCWIHVTSPAGFGPLFSATVPAGTTKSFTSTNGRLSVELGASRVTVTVQILGKTVPDWTLSPAVAPYVVTFRSATT